MFSRKKMSLLYETHNSTLQRTAALYLQDEALVEDVVQEAWLRALRNSRSYNGSGAFAGWMRTIVYNLAMTQHRRAAHVPTEEIKEDSSIGYPAYIDTLAQQQVFLRLMHALSTLPMHVQVSMLLVHYIGLDVNDAARRQHVATNVLRPRLYRARKYLERCMINEALHPRVDYVVLPLEYVPIGIDELGHVRSAVYEEHYAKEFYRTWTTHDPYVVSWRLDRA